ncbi:MAG TPA: DUF2934 domain-containing protein [Steroidobacteraceae bacterium]|jgi:hypothetical protein|nr:DUF2934 domain-containing protein [Steroidobacteraceae bacterium]
MATRRTTGSGRTTESPQAPEKTTQRRRTGTPETPAPAAGASPRIKVSEEARRAMVAEAAFLRAERRGFAAGDEVEDWLAAEAEVDALLRAGNGGRPQH